MVLVAILNPWICASAEYARYVHRENLHVTFAVRHFAHECALFGYYLFLHTEVPDCLNQ